MTPCADSPSVDNSRKQGEWRLRQPQTASAGQTAPQGRRPAEKEGLCGKDEGRSAENRGLWTSAQKNKPSVHRIGGYGFLKHPQRSISCSPRSRLSPVCSKRPGRRDRVRDLSLHEASIAADFVQKAADFVRRQPDRRGRRKPSRQRQRSATLVVERIRKPHGVVCLLRLLVRERMRSNRSRCHLQVLLPPHGHSVV